VTLIIIIFIIMPFLHSIVTTSTLDPDISLSSLLQAPSNYVIGYISTEELNLILEGSHFVVRPPSIEKCVHFILGVKWE